METNVENVFNSYAVEYREPLLQIRRLIYETASNIPEVGELQESLKWGQPSYSPIKARTGSPVRLDKFGEDKIAIFFHCQTNLVSRFKALFQEKLEFSANRAIILDPNIEIPINELSLCIEMALTYHLNKHQI